MLNGFRQHRIVLVSAALIVGCSDDSQLDESSNDDEGVTDFAPGETGDGDSDGDIPQGESETESGDGDGDGDDDDDSDGDEVGDGDGDGDGDDPSNLPALAYCEPVEVWDDAWVAQALEMIEYINQARSTGASCGALGEFPATKPLVWDPALTCAARVHSGDMAEYDFFSHKNMEGKDAHWRLLQAGYLGDVWGENIGAGYEDAFVVFTGWLGNDAHCAELLGEEFTGVGVGYAANANSTYTHYWTLTVGDG